MDYTKVFLGIHGSHLYGLNNENSDTDFKGIFLPTIEELLLGEAKETITKSTGNNNSKNTEKDVDTQWFSLAKFVNLALKGDMVAIDMLHTPKTLQEEGSEIWDFLLANRQRFYTKNMASFLGYIRKQASKYGIKGSRMAALEEVYKLTSTQKGKKGSLYDIWELLPENQICYKTSKTLVTGIKQTFYVVENSHFQSSMPLSEFVDIIDAKWNTQGERTRLAKENNGVDWKAVSHALRAGYQLKDIYEKGTIEFPLRQKEFLMQVKLGHLDFKACVEPRLEAIIEEVDQLAQNSTYPEKADKEFWRNWLLSVYRSQILIEGV